MRLIGPHEKYHYLWRESRQRSCELTSGFLGSGFWILRENGYNVHCGKVGKVVFLTVENRMNPSLWTQWEGSSVLVWETPEHNNWSFLRGGKALKDNYFSKIALLTVCLWTIRGDCAQSPYSKSGPPILSSRVFRERVDRSKQLYAEPRQLHEEESAPPSINVYPLRIIRESINKDSPYWSEYDAQLITLTSVLAWGSYQNGS